MRTQEIISQFKLPDEAVRDLASRHLNEERTSYDGATVITSGHDGGLSYRFFVEWIRNPIKSEIAGVTINDPVDHIEWFRDSKNKICEQVRFIPKELLRFDKDGDCVGGLYRETYERFKAGLSAPGLALRPWNVLDEGCVRTLEETGIFTVEQFAAQPRRKIEGYPQEFQDAFQLAIEYVNGKDSREAAAKTADQLMSVMTQLEESRKETDELRQQLSASIEGGQGWNPPAKVLPKRKGKKEKS